MYLYRSGNSDNYIELPEFNCDHFTLSGWIHSQLSCVAEFTKWRLCTHESAEIAKWKREFGIA